MPVVIIYFQQQNIAVESILLINFTLVIVSVRVLHNCRRVVEGDFLSAIFGLVSHHVGPIGVVALRLF